MIKFYNNKTKKFLKKKKYYFTDGKNYFPIIKSVVRFVHDIDYASMWAEQWSKFQLTQFDSFTKTKTTVERLEFILGESIVNLKGKDILEIGSGAGRFTEILLKSGANVHSIDASNAVEYNYKNNFKKSKKFQIAQADLYDLPYKNKSFDVVVCLGVLQHTPNTTKSLHSIWNKIKKNGTLIVDHYQFTIGYYFGTLWILRLFFKFIPRSRSVNICKKFVKLFFPILWFFRNNKILFRILRKIFPLGFDYHGRIYLTKDQHYLWAELDTHDALTDTYKRLLTKNSFKKMLISLGGKIELFSSLRPGSNGLESRIKKI